MANTYTYSGPGTRWAEGDPTSEDKLNIARINVDHVHEALNALMDTDAATATLLDGVTATTQSAADNSTKIATTAYVDAAATSSFGNGSAGSPSIYATADTNTGAWFPAADTYAVSTGGTERWRVDSSGGVFINDTINTFMTIGLTINQGANDNEAFALKSTDVTHGVTDWAETDTFGLLKKAGSGTGTGGMEFRGMSDDGTEGLYGRAIQVTETTTDTSSSLANFHISSWIKSGTSITTHGTTGNIFGVGNGATTRIILKGNGDLHVTNTTITALDNENDIGLIRTYQRESSGGVGIAMSRHDELNKTRRADLIRTGVWSSTGDFTVQQRMNDLLGGGIWQNHCDIQETKYYFNQHIKSITEAYNIELAELRAELKQLIGVN